MLYFYIIFIVFPIILAYDVYMKTKKLNKSKKRQIYLDISDSEFEQFKAVVRNAGMTQQGFFRLAVLEAIKPTAKQEVR